MTNSTLSIERLLGTEMAWRPDPERRGVFVTEDDDKEACCLRFNDFPNGSLWTLFWDGKSHDLKGMPAGWRIAYNATMDLQGVFLDEETRIEYRLNADTSKSSIEYVIEDVDERCSLVFFDSFYPSPTDPGAYVWATVRENTLIFYRANHGWHNDWEEISKSALTELIYKNRAHNSGRLVLETNTVARAECPKGDKILWHFLYFTIEDIIASSKGSPKICV